MFNQVVPFLFVSPVEILIYAQRYMYKNCFSSSFVIVRHWKKCKSVLREKWLRICSKLWNINTMRYYVVAKKKNEVYWQGKISIKKACQKYIKIDQMHVKINLRECEECTNICVYVHRHTCTYVRSVSTDLSHLLWTVFSRMSVWQTASEDRTSVSLWDRRQRADLFAVQDNNILS